MRLPWIIVVVAACGGSPSQPPVTGARAPARPTPAPSAIPSPGGAPPAPAPPADPRVAADLAAFDYVWQKVNDTFYDPKFGGLDWNAVRTELRPKVESSKDRDEAREIIDGALKRLGKSHFGIGGAPDVDTDKPAGDAEVGLDVRIIGGEPIITRLEAGSPAEAAKVPLGATITAIGDKPLAPRLAAIAKAMPDTSLLPLYQIRLITTLLRGPAGSKVRLTLDTKRKQPTVVELVRAPVGRMVSFGNLGDEPLIYEARWLDKDTAYLRLSIFLDPATVIPAIAKDLAGFAAAKGIVIDLRGNPGGIGGMAMGIAGLLVAEADRKLGTMHTRRTSLDFVINPQPAPYAGKVAILIDELSASTSEIFAGGLQDLGRARVFGRTSPGAALPSMIEKLPNGDRFQYAIADYVSASGKVLEGHGVVPDAAIVLDPKALRAGKDPDIVAATRWIKEARP